MDLAETIYTLQPGRTLAISILVLFLGLYLNQKIKILGNSFIPPSVTGGIICSVLIAIIYTTTDVEISFDMQIRDVLLLVFFSTIGLNANFKVLATGGKALLVLCVIAFVFLIVQDLTGVGLAKLIGVHPGYGLMAGSVSLAGGHGTAIAWGIEAKKAGLENAQDIGLIFATFGLIAGGLLGGPIAKLLILRNSLAPSETNQHQVSIKPTQITKPETLVDTLGSLLALTVCVVAGQLINEFITTKGMVLPGFLTSMFVGIAIANGMESLKFKLHSPSIDRFSEISLNIFLTMSLMSMHLWVLADAAAPIIIALLIQMLVMTLFAVMIVFRFMGKDYDAAVITSGFVGLGLGATPVAIANITEVTRRFGPSMKAFLIIPLVGAFFIDIFNAVVIKAFLSFFSP
ncbi:MAG: sodium/glutamate symporter [Pseudomonadota bacterium]